eukprot:INCI17471.1.p2 GENE.INCI17471.1~~INCI17471.1.p2  ORF type:complete len:122 (+),score=14.16 INCI17471.1:123-488(+)
MASKAKVIIPPKHKYKSTKPVPDLDAEDQPYVVPQAEPVTNDADHPDGDGGVCAAVTILIVGFFVFPAWWGACCQICVPHTNTCAKNTNIASVVLGIFFSIWVPLLIALVVIPNIPSPFGD